ncbi:Protein kinase domain, partial [Dillenia turbinata]
ISISLTHGNLSSRKKRHRFNYGLSKAIGSYGARSTYDSSNWTHTSALNLTSLSRCPSCSYLGWGNLYSLSEIMSATNGLAEENVIGIGDCYGIIYSGVLWDHTFVAVKNFPKEWPKSDMSSDFCSAYVGEFIAEVQALGRIRHKNVVKLLGYCMDQDYRMFVYEYVENGNLHKWLHKCARSISPLSWNIRMKIIEGLAKGLAYLHEDTIPKVIHTDLKSTSVLLDHQWTSKISGLRMTGFLVPARCSWTNQVMETSGYIAPDDFLTEKSDVYSFGILIREIITGRTPIDYSRPESEVVHLIEWVRSMVSSQNSCLVLDPKLPEKPTSKELKRVLLIALRCVDPCPEDRPAMGDVIHMLEPQDRLLDA